MSAERFFSLASRLVAYKGALRMTAEDDKHSRSSSHSEAPKRQHSDSPQPATTAPQEKKVYRDIHHNPELAMYFEKGVG